MIKRWSRAIAGWGFTTFTMLHSSAIGFNAGILPGAGASSGSFLAYMGEKAIVKDNSSQWAVLVAELELQN